MSKAHAVRSASGAKRWFNCPGSINMEFGRPNNSSDAARLGTAAHALGEVCLSDGSDANEWLGGYIRLDSLEYATVYPPKPLPTENDEMVISLSQVMVPIHASEDGVPEVGHEDFIIDSNMADAVQVYLDAVREELARLGDDAELQVEKRFNLSWLIGYDYDEEDDAQTSPGESYISPSGIRRNKDGRLVYADGRLCHGPMFGTNDASVVLLFDHITIFDYKHGQGVVVEVEDNEQELYYALGCAKELNWAFETLDLVIVQPRARHEDGAVRRWSTDKEHLQKFAEKLRLAALATEDPEAPLHAGEWCQFCKAAAVCKELKEQAFAQAGIDFGDGYEEPTAYLPGLEDTDEDLALRLQSIPLLDAFIKAAKTEAFRRLRETPGGQACFGKLVRKKANRAFRSDLKSEDGTPINVFDELVVAGLPREMLYEEPKPKSPAKVEAIRPPELMAKLKAQKVRAPAAYIKSLVAQYTYKPLGGITIAPLTDPREPVDPIAVAADDFQEAEDDTSYE